MTSNSIRKYLMTAAITVACSSAALGQNKSTEGIDWMQELKSRITINGYMQGGYEYSDKEETLLVLLISSEPSSGVEHASPTAGRSCS